MADISQLSDLPVIQPTAEEKAAYEAQFGPAPLNPIRDLSASELADLASADKENFELVSAFRQNQDLWKSPDVVQKVADAHNLIKQRGFSLADLPTPQRAAGMVWDVAKGFGKQLWNYGTAAVVGGMGLAADIAGKRDLAEELQQEGTRRVAENIAGTEQALFGLSEMGLRTGQKIGRASGLAKPLDLFTPKEKVDDLWTAVGSGAVQEDISRGEGGFLQPVGGHVVRELAESGKPVRPEEVNSLAAGDPFSFYLFGKGFQAAGAAVPAPVRAATARAGQQVAQAAEKTAGAAIQTAGRLIDLGGRAAQITGRVAPAVASGTALAAGEPITALAIMGGGRTAARGLQTAGRRVSQAGREVVEAGQQVSGRPVVSPYAQLARDVAYATPGAIGEVVSGTAADIGLAAISAETPQQTESALGIGTVFGGLSGARRIGSRVVSGQLIAPREYGVNNPVASSGNFPAFDAMHSTAFTAASPGVRARLNAVREFARGAGIDTDVFLAPDAPTLERALTDAGVAPETAAQFAQQEGFFTTSLPDKSGNPRRVIVARNVEATPHESFHAFQDVLGEAANRELDALVRQEYNDVWEQEGQRYADRLADDSTRSWEEIVLDASGWGLDAAKEKIYREIHNRLEAETGATPAPDVVRNLADPELVRIFNEAQSRNPGTSPEQFWREILSPEEAKAEADRYIARELAAENFDLVFKSRGVGLTPGRSLPERLARVIGNTISTLGGEPLAGRRSEIGQIEPRFSVTERVAELGRAGATPGAPRPEITPTPRPATPGRGAALPPAEEARTIAENAPNTPVAGGTRSPRELLGSIAEAIAQQAGVKINYLSAPEEPAASTTSNRTVRRAMIEAFRSMPAAARSLWEKTFFPERVRQTKSGYQIQGWAPEVFAANAHKLAQTLAKLPEGQRLIPYELDPAKNTFTEAGWRQLFEDTQAFVRNQMAGQTGAGEPLVVPARVTEGGQYFAPPSTPSRAISLDQTRADTINMLFNFRLPDTPRVESATRLPLNVAGQEISIATEGGPQRLSVPVEPRAPYSGERAQALGIEGRTVLEVNPVRGAIERATSDAGVAMPSFIEAIQRLNLENIKEVQLAPEVPQFRGNTLTLSAGFQPSANPRAIKAAAVRDEKGRVFEGSWHGEAMDVAIQARGQDPIPTETPASIEFEDGFTTNSGEFLSREQALQRAQDLKQVAAADASEFQRFQGLESDTFAAVRQFQPVALEAQRLLDMPTEEWSELVKTYKGKLGSGLTGWAWDIGSSAKTVDDVLALRSATEQLREAARSIPPTMEGFNQRMALTGKAQAAREAYEAATGQNLEGTGEGSALPGIRKYVDPNYTPPVDLRAPEQIEAQFQPKRLPEAQRIAEEYTKERGVPYRDVTGFVPYNRELGRDLAAAYENANHAPDDPKVQAAYGAFKSEILAQFKKLQSEGYDLEPVISVESPYRGGADVARDVSENKHLFFNLSESAFGQPGQGEIQLMLEPTGITVHGKELNYNDMLRAIHDFFGHAKESFTFGPRGEFNAWREHSEMFSPEAQGALAAETIGQTAWTQLNSSLLNPEGKLLRPGDPGFVQRRNRPYAPQKNFVISDDLIARAKGSDVRGQLQPKPATEPEFTLRKPRNGFSKAWILPNGEPVQLGGQWHHEWLNDNADAYGIQTGTNADAESRVQALRKGFARINYGQNGGRLTVEARAADWPKLRNSVRQFVETNLDQIDNLRVELFNDDVSAVADSESARFMNMNSDVERLSSIPFMESAPSAGSTGGQVTGIAQARAREQFQPAAEQSEFEGLPESTQRPFLTTSQLASMSRKELMEHFPEAIVPRQHKEISSDILNAPLIKKAKNPEQVYADKLVEFARSRENNPEYQMGRKWYSEFSTQLKEQFGDDARVFAELLAATSPQTSVETNFKFALDALEGFKSNRFSRQIKKFEEGLSMIAGEKWLPWYNEELAAGRIKSPPAKPTPAAFMARWIESHDLKPRQSNGKLFGINSVPVLQVAARRWLEQNKGPKVRNFVENLLGEGTEATIDLWADRTMRRLGYEGFIDRWRILPINKRGVSDEEFAFSQSVFRNAAQQLGLKPSELQAAVWFAEKQLWADNGWGRLDLGDFRNELKKTEALRAEIRSRENPEPELLSVEPRGRL